MDKLSDKTLIMLISPSAMGKSTIIDTARTMDSRFRRVRSFTTRLPRPDDRPEQFFYLSDAELSQKRQAGELITEVKFPTTGQTYGTLAESYDGEFCLLETLANSVETYRGLPFEKTIAVTITAPAELWRERFTARYPEPSDDALKRLDEAKLSIEWSLSQTANHLWLINNADRTEIAARLIALAQNTATGDNGADDAARCLDAIANMWPNAADTLQ